jgi:hypothetical protein
MVQQYEECPHGLIIYECQKCKKLLNYLNTILHDMSKNQDTYVDKKLLQEVMRLILNDNKYTLPKYIPRRIELSKKLQAIFEEYAKSFGEISSNSRKRIAENIKKMVKELGEDWKKSFKIIEKTFGKNLAYRILNSRFSTPNKRTTRAEFSSAKKAVSKLINSLSPGFGKRVANQFLEGATNSQQKNKKNEVSRMLFKNLNTPPKKRKNPLITPKKIPNTPISSQKVKRIPNTPNSQKGKTPPNTPNSQRSKRQK